MNSARQTSIGLCFVLSPLIAVRSRSILSWWHHVALLCHTTDQHFHSGVAVMFSFGFLEERHCSRTPSDHRRWLDNDDGCWPISLAISRRRQIKWNQMSVDLPPRSNDSTREVFWLATAYLSMFWKSSKSFLWRLVTLAFSYSLPLFQCWTCRGWIFLWHFLSFLWLRALLRLMALVPPHRT